MKATVYCLRELSIAGFCSIIISLGRLTMCNILDGPGDFSDDHFARL